MLKTTNNQIAPTEGRSNRQWGYRRRAAAISRSIHPRRASAAATTPRRGSAVSGRALRLGAREPERLDQRLLLHDDQLDHAGALLVLQLDPLVGRDAAGLQHREPLVLVGQRQPISLRCGLPRPHQGGEPLAPGGGISGHGVPPFAASRLRRRLSAALRALSFRASGLRAARALRAVSLRSSRVCLAAPLRAASRIASIP